MAKHKHRFFKPYGSMGFIFCSDIDCSFKVKESELIALLENTLLERDEVLEKYLTSRADYMELQDKAIELYNENIRLSNELISEKQELIDAKKAHIETLELFSRFRRVVRHIVFSISDNIEAIIMEVMKVFPNYTRIKAQLYDARKVIINFSALDGEFENKADTAE